MFSPEGSISGYGMIRKLDQLGRIVIPIEIYRYTGIKPNEDSVEIFYDEVSKEIVLKHYTGSGCMFCLSIDHIHVYKNKIICESCLGELSGINANWDQTGKQIQKVLGDSQEGQESSEFATLLSKNRSNNINERSTRKSKTDDSILKMMAILQENPKMTQKELANRLKFSQSRISQLKKLIRSRYPI
ncbi:hypothetical protein B1A99_25015 [Cohnella sp. CIP 111063]|uniref:winged helix-turn-helix transcriptional regulator n=1 Tax=unclassified Cohnella TaxID=2636738 RepID=UPI000B8C5735|nr:MULTISPECIES: winged helix-turn-helix transcriptional regulator [unclassified Cohnella]OXS55043.1 hypothetical protein B1A99_25015 [Cohnella sp. CIP 111063]PRX65178.1 bifunctional DNA-binding transcriptional regulator/antitoxin component of YhaV-PrlF toxin-antitoxin module [Cohnella sp. SGD-V74]